MRVAEDHEVNLDLVILLVMGIATGLISSWLAWRGPAFSLGGTSPLATVTQLVTGWTLLGVGLASRARRPSSSFGWLLGLAGIAWFLVEWPNPAAAGSLAFTIGLVFRMAYPALIVHAVLVFPTGRAESAAERAVIALGYFVSIILLGLLPALFFDPALAGCSACPDNVVAIGSSRDMVASSLAVGLRFEVVWAIAAGALFLRRLAHSSRSARRLLAPVFLPGVAFAILVGLASIQAVHLGAISNDPGSLALWLGQALALSAISIGVELEPVRARQARRAISKVAVDLAGAPPTGALRESLAAILGDPGLQLAYAVGDGRLADSDGRSAVVAVGPDRTATPVERGADLVAVVYHRVDLLDDPERLRASIAAARVAIENEQLQAQIRVRMADLRASRVRIVEASDRERRRLEHDLHDGAQQRLAALSMSVGVASLRLESHTSGDERRLAEAAHELRNALSDLRELAHGIFPLELTDGLAAGLGVLAEGAPIPIALGRLPKGRLDPAVESAAYFVIAEATLRSGATKASVSVRVLEDRVSIEVDAFGSRTVNQVAMEDRVGALDGVVTIHPLATAEGMRVTAEIPCES